MSAAAVEAQERAAFVEWRRGLAALEEQELALLTPFEKNLEVWRQLWRVLERSHIVVQVSPCYLSQERFLLRYNTLTGRFCSAGAYTHLYLVSL
jgi:hypothetical protein